MTAAAMPATMPATTPATTAPVPPLPAVTCWQYRIERRDEQGDWVLVTASSTDLPDATADSAQHAAHFLSHRLGMQPRMLASPLRVLVWPGDRPADGPPPGAAEIHPAA